MSSADFENVVKNIDDRLWKDEEFNGELDYVKHTSGILFLRYLDDIEEEQADIFAEMKAQDKETAVLLDEIKGLIGGVNV